MRSDEIPLANKLRDLTVAYPVALQRAFASSTEYWVFSISDLIYNARKKLRIHCGPLGSCGSTADLFDLADPLRARLLDLAGVCWRIYCISIAGQLDPLSYMCLWIYCGPVYTYNIIYRTSQIYCGSISGPFDILRIYTAGQFDSCTTAHTCKTVDPRKIQVDP